MEFSLPVGSHIGQPRRVTALSSNVAVLPLSEPQANRAGSVISKIEAILEAILDDLSLGVGEISIPYRSRTATARSMTRHAEPGTTPGGHVNDVVRFPGRTTHEARKFAALLRILQLSREAIVTGVVITKRNIFYQNTELFKHQRLVDSLVDDLAFTLGFGREDLNIVAAAKGLVVGPIHLTMRNGSTIHCAISHGTLIPPSKLIQQVDFSLTRWVLVIEKEATFRTLAAAGYHTKSLAGHGILLTGKGFPDMATRSFLNMIHLVKPHLPMYSLVDYDPDGVAIMRTYQVGSTSLLHEVNTTAPRLRWLGIRSEHILWTRRSNQQAEHTSGDVGIGSHASPSAPMVTDLEGSRESESGGVSTRGFRVETRTQLSARSRCTPAETITCLGSRDRKAAVSLLQGISAGDEGNDINGMDVARELQIMLLLNIKAEIQAVDNMGDITQWLDERLCL